MPSSNFLPSFIIHLSVDFLFFPLSGPSSNVLMQLFLNTICLYERGGNDNGNLIGHCEVKSKSTSQIDSLKCSVTLSQSMFLRCRVIRVILCLFKVLRHTTRGSVALYWISRQLAFVRAIFGNIELFHKWLFRCLKVIRLFILTTIRSPVPPA